MKLPPLSQAQTLVPGRRRIFIGSYGFEDRSLGWFTLQPKNKPVLKRALMVRYQQPKGTNRISEIRAALASLGVNAPVDVAYDVEAGEPFEYLFDEAISRCDVSSFDEIVVDVSSMTKFALLLVLVKLIPIAKLVRIVYSEARTYAPSRTEYQHSKEHQELLARFPSAGVRTILRAVSLSSIRMQGQPITLVAFTSFNEQLVRHLIGTLNPHRLIFINGSPPRRENAWRKTATQEIHAKLIAEYDRDNPMVDSTLKRTISTLFYEESFRELTNIHEEHGLYERIICAATGSKMQTVGLAMAKLAHPDIHIEYPTPDSYYVGGFSSGIREVHEITISNARNFANSLHQTAAILPM